MDEPESYIERIQRLATQNKELREQLDEMVKRFNNVESVNQHYQEALLKYSPEEVLSDKKSRKKAKRLKTVSILFVTMKGFEELYKHKDPAAMIDLLDDLVMALEDIAFEYNVVKLKSYGDNMIFAAGLQGENRTNPIDIVRVALDMRAASRRIVGDRKSVV